MERRKMVRRKMIRGDTRDPHPGIFSECMQLLKS